jgi:hypothetical protein
MAEVDLIIGKWFNNIKYAFLLSLRENRSILKLLITFFRL